jgi:N utilization substance protein A
VIIQKLREAERETIFEEFKDKEGEIMAGVVQRREGRRVLVELSNRLVGLLPPEEQIPGEYYNIGDRLQVFIVSVAMGSKGPEVILSRSNPEIVKKLFFNEIPEVASGAIEIKAVAREAGFRSKIAVFTDEEGIDPIGSCIGQRGSRIQTIIAQLNGEKIDIIEYDKEPARFIENALSPAKILTLTLNEDEKTALATVKEDQLSLAIGRSGQNVRLASKLTGWKIDIVGEGGTKAEEVLAKEEPEAEKTEEVEVVEEENK